MVFLVGRIWQVCNTVMHLSFISASSTLSCVYDTADLNIVIYHHPPPQPFYGPFPESPGWAGVRRELLDFMVQEKINRDRHTNHLAGRHSIRTNQSPPAPSPYFFPGRMPFLPPNQQCQSTECN